MQIIIQTCVARFLIEIFCWMENTMEKEASDHESRASENIIFIIYNKHLTRVTTQRNNKGDTKHFDTTKY